MRRCLPGLVVIFFVLLGFVTSVMADDRSKLIEKMTKQLAKSRKAEERVDAAKMLGDLKAKEAVPALATALKDPDQEVRWSVAYSLYQISPDAQDAVPALKEALKDPFGHVRLNAVLSLEKMGVPKSELVPAMREVLKDRDPEMRVKAADTLLFLEVPIAEVLPVLFDALSTGDLKVQEAAAEVLSGAGELPADALQKIISSMKNPNPRIRQTLIKVIAKMGMTAGAAVPALVEALRDRDKDVRSESAWTLGKIGTAAKKAIPALAESAIKDPDPHVREYAFRAMCQIDVDDPAALPSFLKGLKDQDKDVRSEALDAFRQIQSLSPEAVSALKEVAASDPDELKRLHAQSMLDQSKKPGSKPAAKTQTSGMRDAIAPLLEQLNKELNFVPITFASAEEAEKYLHERDIDATKDALWSNITQGYADVTKALLKLGVSPNAASTGSADTPLLLTTSHCNDAGQATISLMLLLYGADPNVTDEVNRTPILSAAEKCPIQVVKGLLTAGAKTNVVTNGGYTVLCAAVASGRVDVVRMILNSGYSVKNEPSYLYQTATGKPEIQQLLLKAGVKK